MTSILEAAVVSADQISPEGSELWRPNSFNEWVELKRVDAVLSAWTEQAKQERALRLSTSKWIFGLIVMQILGVFVIVVSIGIGSMNLNVSVLQILISGICAEVFGLGFLVTKFLYREPLKIELASILSRGGGELQTHIGDTRG